MEMRCFWPFLFFFLFTAHWNWGHWGYNHHCFNAINLLNFLSDLVLIWIEWKIRLMIIAMADNVLLCQFRSPLFTPTERCHVSTDVLFSKHLTVIECDSKIKTCCCQSYSLVFLTSFQQLMSIALMIKLPYETEEEKCDCKRKNNNHVFFFFKYSL